MNPATSEVVSRLQMLGLKCEDVPLDGCVFPIAALACFPMYMVANVHGWTSERKFKVPLLDIAGPEAFREAFAIGEEEARLDMAPEHRKVVDSLLSNTDQVLYEHAMETLKEYLAIAQPAVVDRVRTLVARMIVHVAKAAGKGIFGAREEESDRKSASASTTSPRSCGYQRRRRRPGDSRGPVGCPNQTVQPTQGITAFEVCRPARGLGR